MVKKTPFNKRIWLISLTTLLAIFLINIVNAEVTCDSNYFGFNYNQTDLVSKNVHCTNSLNQTVTLTNTGDYFTTNSNNIGSLQSKDFVISFDPNAPLGLHQGQISFSDSSSSIQLFFYVQEKQVQQTGCSIDIFPLSLSNVKVQSGDKKTRTIQLSVPSCFNTSVNVKSLALQTDEKPIQLSEISLGIIQPGGSLLIPIEIDAESGVVSTGQYSDTLSFLLYDQNGNKINVPVVSISVLVTTGINPIGNLSLSMLPSCSLDAVVINKNDTHRLTCTIQNPNILIYPEIDSNFLKGLNVISTSNQYIYEFQGINTGTTTFIAKFKYMNAQIGSDFVQEIKVSPSGSSNVAGVNLSVQFFQNSILRSIDHLVNGDATFLVLDSNNNIIHPTNILINGIPSNNTITLETDKSYEIRIEAPGFNDLVLSNVTVNQYPLDCLIVSQKELYETGDTIYFNSSTENVTYLINDVKVNNPYTVYSTGNITLKCVKEDYISSNVTFQVIQASMITGCSPEDKDWKKGKQVICSLNKNSTWEVINNNKNIASSTGDKIQFVIEDYGTVEIKSGTKLLKSINIESKGLLNWIKDNWIISGAGLVLVSFFIFVYVRNKRSSGDDSQSKYEFSP